MTKYIFSIFTVLFIVIGLLTTSCKKDELVDTNPSYKLSFSNDSIIFDTVFATIGSSTRELHIYNTNNSPIEISKIYLTGDSKTQFSINVDGVVGPEVENVRIEANDSIFLFAKVTINPNNQTNPFFVGCDIVFETNGNEQQVNLVAFGQNAHYITPNLPEGNNPFYSLVSGVWDDDLPYVVYGYAVVDSLESLTINKGCRVHFHKDALLWVYNSASLKVLGEVDSVVTFTNDRLESFYSDLPGQWRGLFLAEGSFDNVINHAVIKNANLGVQCDRYGNSTNPTLTITNSKILNMSIGGLAGNGTSIVGQNLVFANCAEYAVSLNGGQFDFRQITIGNYPNSSHSSPSFLLTNFFYQRQPDGTWAQAIIDPTTAFVGNSIIYGSNQDELFFEQLPEGVNFDYTISNSLLRSNLSNSNHYVDCVKNQDPLFLNIENANYQLDSLSPARKMGVNLDVPFDILGNPRPIENPDIGAYQMDYLD